MELFAAWGIVVLTWILGEFAVGVDQLCGRSAACAVWIRTRRCRLIIDGALYAYCCYGCVLRLVCWCTSC